ncbi:hypothetical protein SEA_SURVIVORS_50 [Gordonia phage Survivors]|nr:hypothetical protein SEA_SURVIVORS_50 [Gordonia phage Survivors]WNM75499.1 hypothetical protein SEA_NIBBLES_49 [Gordonia phage Nibbles]
MSDDIERFPTESGLGMYEQRKHNWDDLAAFQEYVDRLNENQRQEEMKNRLRTLFAQPGVEYANPADEAPTTTPKFDRAQRRKYAKCKHKRVKKSDQVDKVSLSCQDCGYTVSRDKTAFDWS